MDVFIRIEKAYSEESGTDQINFMYNIFIEVERELQSQAKIRKDIEAEMIMAIFNALINIDSHKDEVGLNYFPEVIEYLTEFALKGLMGETH